MRLSDAALARLRAAVEAPELGGTKYRLLRELGRGGMGVVYAAEDTELGREVALKVLSLPEQSPVAVERMRREARILARLEHPGIVPVHDVGTLPDGRVFYVMKMVRGRRLDEHRASATLRDLLRLLQRVCEAVAFAHDRGVIHRDLKPQNIMIGAFGEVLVMDWGVAQSVADAVEPAGTRVGTQGYMAPEQMRGETSSVGPAADVFALGAILKFLAGEGAARPLAAVSRKAMAADPESRYASALELAQDVGRYLSGEPVSAYRENLLERAARVVANNRVLFWLVVAYVLMRSLVFLLWR
jgi:serine/threonine protein kinase